MRWPRTIALMRKLPNSTIVGFPEVSGCSLAVVTGLPSMVACASGRQFHSHIRTLQLENTGMRRSLGKYNRVARIGAESIVAGFEPEQARQGTANFACGRRPVQLSTCRTTEGMPHQARKTADSHRPRAAVANCVAAIANTMMNNQDCFMLKFSRSLVVVRNYLLNSCRSGNGSKSCPLKICSNSVSNAGCTNPLDATVS